MTEDYVDFDEWAEEQLRKTQAGELLELSAEETGRLLDLCLGIPELKRVEDSLRRMSSRAKVTRQVEVLEGLCLFVLFLGNELKGVYANATPPVQDDEIEEWLWFRKENGENKSAVNADFFCETDMRETQEMIADGKLLPPSREGPWVGEERFFVCRRKEQQT